MQAPTSNSGTGAVPWVDFTTFMTVNFPQHLEHELENLASKKKLRELQHQQEHQHFSTNDLSCRDTDFRVIGYEPGGMWSSAPIPIPKRSERNNDILKLSHPENSYTEDVTSRVPPTTTTTTIPFKGKTTFTYY